MEIRCEHCQGLMKIPDDRVPAGKSFSVNCPRCKKTTAVSTADPPEAARRKDQVAQMCDQIASEQYDASEKPFDFIDQEGKTALICEPDNGLCETVSGTLKLLDYHFTVCRSARQALKNMRYHDYDLIVLNELFDTPDPDANGVLIFLERLAMEIRRDFFVVLISNRYRSMDHMMALRNSVDLIVNPKDMADFGKILVRAISDHEFFYRPFRDIKLQVEESA